MLAEFLVYVIVINGVFLAMGLAADAMDRILPLFPGLERWFESLPLLNEEWDA